MQCGRLTTFTYFCIVNLIVDIGNSTTKLAVYRGSERLFLARLDTPDSEAFRKEIKEYDIERAIVSSTKIIPPGFSEQFLAGIPFIHFLSHSSRLPFKMEYETPETLGTDRIAAVAGGCSAFPGTDLLIIDAGTAITYEYLLNGVYKGGNISPGLKMRFSALNRFTERLPLDPPYDITIPGKNTAGAIAAGIVNGVIYEINKYIRTFAKEHTFFRNILTGGDGGFLNERIDHRIEYMPEIVIDGLNNILEYNAK